MTKRTGPTVEGIITELASRNVKWDRMRRRIAAALGGDRPELDPGRHMGPFVTVGRQHGAGGAELAHRVGAVLGWPVLDHEVIDLVAAHLRVDPAMVKLFEEDEAGWVSDVLGDFMPADVVTRDTYAHELRRVIQLLAMQGEVVLLGRGAHLFLPRGRGLTVRVIASLDDRVARLCARDGLDEGPARGEIEKIDKKRAHFVMHTFGRDIADPLLYDLVLNTSWSPIDKLADAVGELCRVRWPAGRA